MYHYDFVDVQEPHTPTATFALTPIATNLNVICTPDTVDTAGSMNTVISGVLTTDGCLPIGGQTIMLSYDDGSAWRDLGSATTQPDGSYSYLWTASGLANGIHMVQDVYTGDGNPYLSSNAFTGQEGLFVVPEYAFGALGALIACIAGFVVVKNRQVRNQHP
ncbi:MAG: hypothetical protein NWE92_07980 [Candidatus Bathyarchaeota archaeon]|nr:hypothetical protein [Candidatus Bathyarchaeota archaeon]